MSAPPHPASPGGFKELLQTHLVTFICWALILATIAAYWPVHNADFINLDDHFMIYNNPIVASGWTVPGFGWALTTSYFEYWHPLTWLSHMTDCQLFGLQANWHHRVSLGFHVLNTLMVFVLFREMTGKVMRSGVVAALFALHPMHVESVAWLAERKDVLSTLFMLLSLWAYVRYFKANSVKSPSSELFYRLSLVFFVCGAMSKPMVVTLPFVLLLLDFWPLNRFSETNPEISEGAEKRLPQKFWARLLNLAREKMPFFGIAFFSCLITFSNVKSANNIISAEVFPWSLRLSNVPVSYARYVAKFFWPVDMEVQYPLPARWETWQVALSLFVLVCISIAAIKLIRSAPYFFCGWCIFLGTLVPTISLVQVGYQAMADRYTYVSYLGLFMAVVWGAADLLGNWRHRVLALSLGTATVLVALGITTSVQAAYWQNNFTLWPHCLKVSRDNFSAHYNYGFALQNLGKPEEAIVQYREALRLRPKYLDAKLNLGRQLAATGQMTEAIQYFRDALRQDPKSASAHENMGLALFEEGDFAGSEKECAESARLDPAAVRPLIFLGRAQIKEGKLEPASDSLAAALKLHPSRPDEFFLLGVEFLNLGQLDEAITCLQTALRFNAAWPEAQAKLQEALEKRANIK